MIRNGGVLDGVRILAPRTVALMRTNQVGTLHSPTASGSDSASKQPIVSAPMGWTRRARTDGPARTARCIASIRSARLVMLLMIQLLPNTTDIRTKFPALVYQALVDR